ncbi:MAG: hypothetical protein ACR2JX_03175 [Mycobacteriales bacterium]
MPLARPQEPPRHGRSAAEEVRKAARSGAGAPREHGAARGALRRPYVRVTVTGALDLLPIRPTAWYVPAFAASGLAQFGVEMIVFQVTQYVSFSFGCNVCWLLAWSLLQVSEDQMRCSPALMSVSCWPAPTSRVHGFPEVFTSDSCTGMREFGGYF